MENLKLLRKESGVSQQTLANAIGSSQQSIHRYEKGDYKPDIRTLKLLADYFNTSIDFLVGRTTLRERSETVAEYALNQEETMLMERYRVLAPGYQKYITTMIEALGEVSDSGE